jgi:hypothetical protein
MKDGDRCLMLGPHESHWHSNMRSSFATIETYEEEKLETLDTVEGQMKLL